MVHYERRDRQTERLLKRHGTSSIRIVRIILVITLISIFWHVSSTCLVYEHLSIGGSVVESSPATRGGGPGSIPGQCIFLKVFVFSLYLVSNGHSTAVFFFLRFFRLCTYGVGFGKNEYSKLWI